ncbi:glycosyltransferase family 1 protein [Prolixibacteraceae bacterium JC049]|nr:glycosyltransferase family 1 protein [Prolixibacteraceae bacterium JC049]
MKIVVNTRLLLKNKLEGIGWFSYETLQRMVNNHPEHQFFFLFDRPYSDKFVFATNVTPVVIGPPTRHPILWYIWFEWQLPKLLKQLKADLFVSPDGYLSLSSKVPQIPVIHDINFVHRPKDLPFTSRWYYNHFFPKFAHKAKQIVTVSNYSKNDITNTYQVNPEKIDVVYNGVNKLYQPLKKEEQIKVRKKYAGSNPYFLYVGALHPRKNILGLLKAFEQYKNINSNNYKLVLVGSEMFGNKEAQLFYQRMLHRDDIIFTGRVPSSELAKLLASAQALVFVPFFEGFGIPIIEAMVSGTPVICSKTTSLPEVGGDAAFYVDPHDTNSIAEALKQLTDNEQLRAQMIDNGFKQCQQFSWDKTAQLFWGSIQKVIDNL